MLITAGPTREQIDPVRYISNHSSGKMGFALADAANQMGAEVTLVSGPTELEKPSGVNVINILSTKEMFTTVKKEFRKADILIMAAAPADFTPAKLSKSKLKKADAIDSIPLKPTVDILKSLKELKTNKQLVIGFALETDNPVENARKKLKDKNLDMIVLNQPTENSGFGTETNKVTIITPRKKPIELSLKSKSEISHEILDLIESML